MLLPRREGAQVAEGQNLNESLKRFTQQQFQEEVARELGIDLNSTTFPNRDVKNLENDLHHDAAEEESPS